VRYEDVVTDTERVARRLLDYCGLPWSQRCLAFHEAAAAVATASASQVRRPIYASSIGKWRAYRTELQPLLSALRAEGIVIED
jgi:RPA family protein